jgi:pimeloyl-ACP methyl ester carboxylesterase
VLSHHRVGAGKPVVLIHGVGSQWQVWEPVIPLLERSRDVIALDLPGFGGSPVLPAGVVPNASSLAGAVVSFLDSLGLSEPVVVGGNSLGGWVGLELAVRGRASAVVGVSPAGFATRLESAVARASLRMSWHGSRLLSENLLRRPGWRKLAYASLMGDGSLVPAGAAIGATRNLASSPGFDATVNQITSERFTAGERVGVPVTLVWGTRDAILFPWQARRALRELPRARLVPLPGAGHVPTWEAPEAIARELLAA